MGSPNRVGTRPAADHMMILGTERSTVQVPRSSLYA